MNDQTDIEEYIEEQGEDAAKVSAGPGRPASERTRVTTVNMCTAMKELPNAEKIARIRHWLNTVDLGELIENVCAAMLEDAKQQRRYRRPMYRPIKFDWDWQTDRGATGNSFGHYDSLDELTNEVRSAIRIQVPLHDQVISAADVLGVHPASVIRMALAEMYLDNGRMLLESVSIMNGITYARVPDLRVRARANSVTALKGQRRWLQEDLEIATDPERRASIQAKIDAIKV